MLARGRPDVGAASLVIRAARRAAQPAAIPRAGRHPAAPGARRRRE
jgi:hypothetical protein